jgi:large subunit ribosomal protein L31e
MAPEKKKSDEKKSQSIKYLVTWRYTTNIHKHIQRVGFKKCALWAFKQIQKTVMKEIRTLDVQIDIKLSKASEPKE